MAAEPRVLPLRAPSGEIQWTIVELQGTLEAKAASLDGFHLGDLFERRGAVWLRIGKGEMPGERVRLKKPLAIMSKVRPDGDVPSPGGSPPACEYHAVGVVREKLVFNTRPTPISRLAAQQQQQQQQQQQAAATKRLRS